MELQNKVVELGQSGLLEQQSGFADMWIVHEPVYRIVVAFTDRADRHAFMRQLDPSIRQYVQVRYSPRTRAQNGEVLNNISQIIFGEGISHAADYRPENNQIMIVVSNNQDAQRVRSLIPPEYRGITLVRVGVVPVYEQNLTGVSSVDRVQGGSRLRPSTAENAVEGFGNCTVGFVVTYGSGRRGFVTAGHCAVGALIDPTGVVPEVKSLHLNVGNRLVQLPQPIRPAYIDKQFDYVVYDAGNMTANNTIYFNNLERIPEFPSVGHLNVTNMIRGDNQYCGLVVCKSGVVTGITCGQILSVKANVGNNTKMIQVGQSLQRRLSAGGDSGGPWFLYPGRSTNVTAAGIHHRGNSPVNGPACEGRECVAYYMPIDRIEHSPLEMFTGFRVLMR